jgi:hypothetical protein
MKGKTMGAKAIQDRVMIQLRLNAFIRGKFRQALNSIYVGSSDVSEVIEILMEAEQKIRNLLDDDMRKVR